MIDYGEIISKHKWIIKDNQKVVLSPDSDGLLCGLFMSKMYNWEVVGYYDGKVLLLKNGLKASECIFFDVDIFRKDICSVGHHMVLYNKRHLPGNWNNFDNCIQPNNIRGYDCKNNFRVKYPLGTIHLLLGIVGSQKEIEITKDELCPLLYTDGTFKNLLNYPENCLEWLQFLKADSHKNPLNAVFFNEHFRVHDLMVALKDFFEDLSKINQGKRGADKIKISNTKGEPVNIERAKGVYSISHNRKVVAENFLLLLSQLTGWGYKPKFWTWNNLKLYKFSKDNTIANNREFNVLMAKEPLSWAITAGSRIEFTLEKPDKLP